MNNDLIIPKAIQDLPTDPKRGYPIPFIVLIDKEGTPHFKVNDHDKAKLCIELRLCHVCGQPLRREFWFIGGQLSAFHPHGAFGDGPLHRDCGLFALHTCPYLALRNYHAGGEDALKRTAEKLQGKADVAALVDKTQTTERLPFFCFVQAKDFTVSQSPLQTNFKPTKPYLQVEYYTASRRIHKGEAKQLLRDINQTSYLP